MKDRCLAVCDHVGAVYRKPDEAAMDAAADAIVAGARIALCMVRRQSLQIPGSAMRQSRFSLDAAVVDGT